MTNQVKLKKVDLTEITLLQKICKEVYSIYFSDYWEKNGLELYLENQFGTERLRSDLANKAIGFYFILFEKEAIGFLKINFAPITIGMEGFEMEDICELEKMYIFPEYKRNGIGKWALHTLIDKIRKRRKTILFLCVINTNNNAISFYEKLGFKYHNKTRVEAEHFKEELNGLDRMVLELK